MAQFARRARTPLRGSWVLLGGMAVAGWLSGSPAIGWCALAMATLGGLPPILVAWPTWRDFRARGGKPLRMRYHVCDSGIEVRAAGRIDWLTWENLWEAGDTRRSFLLSPTPREQYVISKRCCGERAATQLRGMPRNIGSLAAHG